jgi:NAD(P)-dependent dehydrogenase (short-subunit alcohol dehydrogenase family)
MSDPTPIEKLSQRFPAKRAFITGAASGLGQALALEFAREGWRLGIVDISQQRLELT